MPQLKVDVPDSLLEETARKRIDSLERKVKSLEKKIVVLESQEREAKRAIAAFSQLRMFFADHFDLYEDWGM